jgi:hypothetical protein
MPFSGFGFKQLVPRPLTPFVFINDLYYNPSTNLMWVADVEIRNAKMPVLNATTGALVAMVDLSAASGWPTSTFNNTGPQALLADSTYVYAFVPAEGAVTSTMCAIINQSTFQVVGVFKGTLAGNPNTFIPYQWGQQGIIGGNLYVCVAYSSLELSPYINIAEFNIAAAISAGPSTPVGASAANTNVSSSFNFRTLTASGSSLYLGTANGQVGGVGDTEYLYTADTSMSTTLQYTDTDVAASGYNYLSYHTGSIYAAIGNPSSTPPYYQFDTSPAQVYKNGSPFITFPTTTPNLTGAGATRITPESYNETLLISTSTFSQYGPGILLRYNPASGGLYSYFGNTDLSQLSIVTAAQATPSHIWMSKWDAFPINKSTIMVFTSAIGTETLVNTITGY